MELVGIKTSYIDALSVLYDPAEAESIFFHVASSLLNYSKIEIRQNLSNTIDEQTGRKFSDFLQRLLKGEPVQYILGYAEFCDLRIYVDSRVLIPRPETEIMTDMIIRENRHRSNLRIIDLCTGSGCIAIALSKNLPAKKVIGIDISVKALELASLNAKANNAEIVFIPDDLQNLQNPYSDFDIVVSNPPYVREMEKQYMQLNVLNYEPSIALFVPDQEPLLFYKAIADFCMKHMTLGGLIYSEINENFGPQVKSLLLSKGFRTAEIRKDLRNKDRFLIASV